MRAKQHYGLPQPALARLRERQAVPVSQRVPEAASICPSAPRPALPAALPALSSVPGRLISKPAPARRLDVRLRGDQLGTRWRRTVQPTVLGQPRSPQPPLSPGLRMALPVPSGCLTHSPWSPATLPRCTRRLFPAAAPQVHISPLLSPPAGNREKRCVDHSPRTKPSLVNLETNLGLNLSSTTGCFS